jgi:hypothetical protein
LACTFGGTSSGYIAVLDRQSRYRAGWRLTQTLQPADLDIGAGEDLGGSIMSESPIDPGAEPEARPTEDPEITPSSAPDGSPTAVPAEPSVTNPDANR